MHYLFIFTATLLAAFTQSISGFGLASVSMPILLFSGFRIQTASPYVALMSILPELILLTYYRKALNPGAVVRLIAASLVGIVIGVISLDYLNETLALLLLGAVLVIYSMYALLQLRLPTLEHPLWAYLTGAIAGFLGGAFNTTGPPVIIYGHSRGWTPPEFKSNLQGFFVVNTIVIAVVHALRHNLTPEIWQYYLWAGLPAIAIGLVSGIALDKYIHPQLFRKIVLIALALSGFSLIFG